jgi:hypothetical protein
MRQGYVLALSGDYWPNAAWYARCLSHHRHPAAWQLEVRLANYAVREGIVFA